MYRQFTPKNSVERVCVNCKKVFRALNKELSRGPRCGRYCCVKCRTDYERGENNPMYRGGKRITKLGYVELINAGGPKALVYEHRVIMERMLGRALAEGELVHHVNGVKTDNREENLHLCAGTADHRRLHGQIERLVYDMLERGFVIFDREAGEYRMAEDAMQLSLL